MIQQVASTHPMDSDLITEKARPCFSSLIESGLTCTRGLCTNFSFVIGTTYLHELKRKRELTGNSQPFPGVDPGGG